MAGACASHDEAEMVPSVCGDEPCGVGVALEGDEGGALEAEVVELADETRAEPQRSHASADIAEDEEAACGPRVEACGFDDTDEGVVEAIAINVGGGKGVGGVREAPYIAPGAAAEL